MKTGRVTTVGNLPQHKSGFDAWMDSDEMAHLWRIGTEAAGTCILSETIGVVAIMFIGRLGAVELGAGTLSYMWTNCSGNAILWGLTGALDTQCTQAYGAKQYEETGVHFQRAVLILTVLSAVVAVLWMTTSVRVFSLFELEQEQADMAAEFSYWSILGIWPAAVFRAATKWCQAQNYGRPPVVGSMVGAVVNPILMYLLVFHYDLKLMGAALALSLTNWAMLGALVWYVRVHDMHACTWTAPDWAVLWSNWAAFFKFGAPSAAMLCFEWWSWELGAAIAASLGTEKLAAHGIVMNLGVLYYTMFPMGLQQAAAVRVGNLLGAGHWEQAKVCSQTTISASVAMMLEISTLIYIFRDQIGLMFTSDPTVLVLLPSVITVFAAFSFVDGIAAATQGILRGSGNQNIGAKSNFISYYVVGLPSGYFLVFRSPERRLDDLWTGLALGSAAAMVILLYIVRQMDFKQTLPTGSSAPLSLEGAPGMPDPPSDCTEEEPVQRSTSMKVTRSSRRPSAVA